MDIYIYIVYIYIKSRRINLSSTPNKYFVVWSDGLPVPGYSLRIFFRYLKTNSEIHRIETDGFFQSFRIYTP